MWTNNGLSGTKVVETTNTEKYEGDWTNGKRSGPGMLSRDGQTVFEGTFKDGQFWEGKGSYSFEQGPVTTYYGAW